MQCIHCYSSGLARYCFINSGALANDKKQEEAIRQLQSYVSKAGKSEALGAVDLQLLIGKVYSQWDRHFASALAVYDGIIERYPEDFRCALKSAWHSSDRWFMYDQGIGSNEWEGRLSQVSAWSAASVHRQLGYLSYRARGLEQPSIRIGWHLTQRLQNIIHASILLLVTSGYVPDTFTCRGYLARGALLKENGRKADAQRMFIQARYFAPSQARAIVEQIANRWRANGHIPAVINAHDWPQMQDVVVINKIIKNSWASSHRHQADSYGLEADGCWATTAL